MKLSLVFFILNVASIVAFCAVAVAESIEEELAMVWALVCFGLSFAFACAGIAVAADERKRRRSLQSSLGLFGNLIIFLGFIALLTVAIIQG